jgi:glucose-1-phosphate thymidylyltransferase
MKGIVLAGGKGSRLYPLTLPVSKQLLPLYDKPMIYYPLATLMQASVREIVVITDSAQQESFRSLLGSGAQWGLNFDYIGQTHPRGIAEALILAEPFLAGEDFILILGDNLFHGARLSELLALPLDVAAGIRAAVYAHPVRDPERYGVITLDQGRPVRIVEKPSAPESNLAVTGLYKYTAEAVEVAKALQPSARGELEITDVNNHFLEKGQIECVTLGPGYAWLDTGTPEAILQAGEFIHALQERQGTMLACLEEIAFRSGWITSAQLAEQAKRLSASEYGRYLGSIAMTET